jgi:hypothetical protein
MADIRRPNGVTTPLQRESLGARGLEHFARNSACLRLGALTMLGVSPAQAAQVLFGEDVLEGQSPFAMHVGNQFEAHVFEDDAKALLALYVQTGRLSNDDVEVIDVVRRHPGTSSEALQARHELTLECLEDAVTAPRARPLLLIHPRLHLDFLDHTIDIEPDALLIMHDSGEIYPIEVKSYVDRGGYTSASSIRSACRQAAVGVVALQRELGMPITARVDLILRQPTRFEPTLRPMTLEGEVESLETTLDSAPEQRLGILALLEEEELTIRDQAQLKTLPNHFCEGCKEHCALAPLCKREAFEAGSPAALGQHAQEALRATTSLPYAWALLRGEREPASTQEATLLEQLRELEEAFHHIHPRTPEDGGTHGC